MSEGLDAKERLLSRAYAYALEHGLAGLTLRPVGIAVDASPRTLLYHFGSKEAFVAAIVERSRERLSRLFDEWNDRSADYRGQTLVLGAWQWLSAPRHEPLMRLAFEAQALALRDRRRGVARAMFADWSTPLARRLERAGFARDRAASLATLLAATMRGLIAEMIATGERTRVERVFRSFVAAIEFPT